MPRNNGKDRGLFERPPHSGTWWIRYHDAHGKEHREKIGSKSLARQAYAKRKTQIREGQFFPETFQRRKTILLHDFIQEYLKEAKANHRAFATDICQAKYWTKIFGAMPLQDLTTSHLEKWKIERLASVKPATVVRGLAWLKHLYNVAIRDEKVEKNPVTPIKFPKPNNVKVRFLTDEEEKALKAAMEPAHFELVELALHTGMRRSEQFNLRWDDVDLRNQVITIPCSKSGERRHVPLNARALEILFARHKRRTTDWVFPSKNPDTPLDSQNFVNRIFMPAVKRAAIKNFSWHSCRHTAASRLVMRGVDIRTVQIILGHANITVTLRYAHLAPSHLKEAINRLVNTDG